MNAIHLEIAQEDLPTIMQEDATEKKIAFWAPLTGSLYFKPASTAHQETKDFIRVPWLDEP